MPRRKIIAINIGVSLEIREGGKIRKISKSGIAPSPAFATPEEAINAVNQFIQDNAGKSKPIRKAAAKK
jgi:hypothetical protein